MSDTVPRAEYDRVLAQRNALRSEVAQPRSQLAPQAQRSLVAQNLAPQQSAQCDSRSSGSARERTTTERPAKRVRVHERSAPLADYMRAVLEQAPSAMLSMLDDAAQRALWAVMPHTLSARQISVAQQLWARTGLTSRSRDRLRAWRAARTIATSATCASLLCETVHRALAMMISMTIHLTAVTFRAGRLRLLARY